MKGEFGFTLRTSRGFPGSINYGCKNVYDTRDMDLLSIQDGVNG